MNPLPSTAMLILICYSIIGTVTGLNSSILPNIVARYEKQQAPNIVHAPCMRYELSFLLSFIVERKLSDRSKLLELYQAISVSLNKSNRL